MPLKLMTPVLEASGLLFYAFSTLLDGLAPILNTLFFKLQKIGSPFCTVHAVSADVQEMGHFL
jgi:hypothetical protein